jgi:two-component system, NtrC family, sensor histidine kinase PilS
VGVQVRNAILTVEVSMRLAHHSPPMPASPMPQTLVPTDLARRVIGLLNFYRLLIAPALLAINWLSEPSPTVGRTHPTLFLSVCALYFVLGIVLVLAQRWTWPSLRALALGHILVDTLSIALILYSSGGAASGLGILLVLPVGATTLMTESGSAYLIAAIATLGILLQQLFSYAEAAAAAVDYSTAGVLGGVIFVIAFGAQLLVRRLSDSEALVKRQEVDLANMAQLSQYIFQHLRESMMVVDPEHRIRLVNESAAHLLGDEAAFPGAQLGTTSPRLEQLLLDWRRNAQAGSNSDTAGTFIAADGAREIQPHFAPLGSVEPAPVLVFLEDTSVLAGRIQQSKLASLGRLSASIAHEIRNPVGAMSHAGQLLGESPALSDEDRKLTAIIRRNAGRVSEIIDNVLQMSRRDSGRPERIVLANWLDSFAQEFCATMQWPATQLQLLGLEPGIEIRADPSQLRQVLWNLCENAVKYGCPVPESTVEVTIGRLKPSARPFLEVADRGQGIAPEDAERIFEPFFSAEQRGSGLGLFLAREIAQSNSATLIYEARSGGGSSFRLVFSDPARWES